MGTTGGCLLDDTHTSPAPRAYVGGDAARVRSFRDAGCGGATDTSGVGSTSGVSGVGCPGQPEADGGASASPCGQVTFRLAAPDARTVWVSGSFSGWAIAPPGALPLFRDPAGLWTRTVDLGPGTHSYKFIVDGEWMLDPANPLVALDEHGNPNSVFDLCGAEP
jgi:hypothetical protein